MKGGMQRGCLVRSKFPGALRISVRGDVRDSRISECSDNYYGVKRAISHTLTLHSVTEKTAVSSHYNRLYLH